MITIPLITRVDENSFLKLLFVAIVDYLTSRMLIFFLVAQNFIETTGKFDD